MATGSFLQHMLNRENKPLTKETLAQLHPDDAVWRVFEGRIVAITFACVVNNLYKEKLEGNAVRFYAKRPTEEDIREGYSLPYDELRMEQQEQA